MERREVLAGLAVVLAATPALAQQNPAPPPMSANPPMSGGPARADAPMGEAEMRHARDTMMVGTLALATSRVAIEKARNTDVKQFANFEVAEQTTVAEVLRGMMGGNMNDPNMAPPQMDAEGQRMMQQLSQAQPGRAFDQAYAMGQLEGHRKLLQIQEGYMSSGGNNREHLNVARLVRGMVKEHLELLAGIERELGRG